MVAEQVDLIGSNNQAAVLAMAMVVAAVKG